MLCCFGARARNLDASSEEQFHSLGSGRSLPPVEIITAKTSSIPPIASTNEPGGIQAPGTLTGQDDKQQRGGAAVGGGAQTSVVKEQNSSTTSVSTSGSQLPQHSEASAKSRAIGAAGPQEHSQPSQNDVAGTVPAQAVQQTANLSTPPPHLSEATDQEPAPVSSVSLKPYPESLKGWDRARAQFQVCAPEEVITDITHLQYIGCGGYSRVFKGMWHSSVVAVKFATSRTTDLVENVRHAEALLCKELSHPNVVQTFATRSTQLTAEFMESLFLERKAESKVAPTPRSLDFQSGDGFGDPRIHEKGNEASVPLRDILFSIGASPGDFLTVIIMDYSDKGSLTKAIARGVFKAAGNGDEVRVRYRALLRTAREIAQGLDHLHRLDVVHGDLKSGNVLLKGSRSDRRGFVAQVIDFGLSVLVYGSENQDLSKAQGTLLYMAPEVFAGKVSKAADIYAFGVLLYELLTGSLPYKELTQGQIVMGVQIGTLRPPWPPGNHPELEQLFRRCVAQDPRQRPKAHELVDELMRIEVEVRTAARRAAQQAGMSLEGSLTLPSTTEVHANLRNLKAGQPMAVGHRRG